MRSLTESRPVRLGFLAALVLASGTGPLPAAVTNAAPESRERIGIYDSRAVAYAAFWSDAHQRKLAGLSKEAREARAAGQEERLRELEAALRKDQERTHLQVFSTAPVDDVMAGLKDRLPAIQREADVSRLVSKWDDQALKDYPRATRVDVTDALLREFHLDDKQLKVVRDIRSKKPLPLDKAKRLAREGKL